MGCGRPHYPRKSKKFFFPLFDEAGKPTDMAVFTRNESEGRVHCVVIAYFTPAAYAVAEAFDAEPCEKPSRTGLGLLAGDPNCWVFFFPDGNLEIIIAAN